MKNIFKALLITAIFYSSLALVGKFANALDDFDLMKYGPDDTIEIGRTEVIIKLVTYNSAMFLNDAFNKASKKPMPEGSGVRGFAIVKDDEDVCFIHIIPAKIWDDREAMAIMGHELYHCLLSDHKDIIINEIAEVDTNEDDQAKGDIEVPQDIEDLYAEDRRLELEWLKDEYVEMGIQIDDDT